MDQDAEIQACYERELKKNKHVNTVFEKSILERYFS